MAKVTIEFTEDEVRKMLALKEEYETETVELCGHEPAYLEAGLIEDFDFPNEVELFVTTLHVGKKKDKWEKHWLCSIGKEDLKAGVPYEIFVG